MRQRRRFLSAQAMVEYVILFLIILGLFAAFLGQVKTHLEAYHNGMVAKIATK